MTGAREKAFQPMALDNQSESPFISRRAVRKCSNGLVIGTLTPFTARIAFNLKTTSAEHSVRFDPLGASRDESATPHDS
jgi:hypothetical protein